MFLRWCHEQAGRPVTAREILDNWPEHSERAAAQRDDRQAATVSDLVATLQAAPVLTPEQERHLVAYIDCLPRDLRFALVKSLLKIPPVAAVLAKDEHDRVVLEAIRAISREA